MRYMLSVIMVAAVLGLGSAALAHDGNLETDFSDWTMKELLHDPELEPWKGWAFVTVMNSSTDNYWTDFHFQIGGASHDAKTVVFTEAAGPPVSSQTPFTYEIGTTPDGYSSLDLYFPDDPVGPNEIATFQVYTDNTTQPNNTWFGLCMYPTPEPTMAMLLGLGGLTLLRRRR